MYSPSSFNPSSTGGVNNPFINDPTNARNRFPDITGNHDLLAASAAQYTSSWPYTNTQTAYTVPNQTYGQPQTDTGYTQQLSPTSSTFPTQGTYFDPNLNGRAYATGSLYDQSYATPQTQRTSQGFQPSSSFGQQMVAATTTGYSYGPQAGYYQAPQQQQPQQQQPANQLPSYLAQFDPYSAIGHGWDGASQSQPQSQPHSQPQSQSHPPSRMTGNPAPPGQSHPRDYIRLHKTDLEAWDTYAWKQALGTFDSLKEAWDTRKAELTTRINQLQMQMQFGYLGANEGSTLKSMLKEAESNSDSVAASAFQMREVFSGYRHSGDAASKARVRESCNAALKNLPEWPGSI